jgi:aldose 1-epimerase
MTLNKSALLLGAALACALASNAEAATAKRGTFGRLADGRAVASVTLSNARGVSANIIAWGASIQSVIMPDRNGRKADVALGYDNIDQYLSKPQYFGAIVGRVGQSPGGGPLQLDGQCISDPVNNGKNALHGGTTGFDKVLWEVVSVPRAARPLR